MSLFRIPQGVAKEIENIEWRFLWSGGGSKTKMHLMDWGIVCNYCENCGLRLLSWELKNKALLNKWLWTYENDKRCLWREIIDGKTGGNPSELLLVMGKGFLFGMLSHLRGSY